MIGLGSDKKVIFFFLQSDTVKSLKNFQTNWCDACVCLYLSPKDDTNVILIANLLIKLSRCIFTLKSEYNHFLSSLNDRSHLIKYFLWTLFVLPYLLMYKKRHFWQDDLLPYFDKTLNSRICCAFSNFYRTRVRSITIVTKQLLSSSTHCYFENQTFFLIHVCIYNRGLPGCEI